MAEPNNPEDEDKRFRLLSWINPRQMGKTRTMEFLETLPPTPLIQHLAQLHTLYIHAGGAAPEHNNGRGIFEHTLREIAAYTVDPEVQMRQIVGRTRPSRNKRGKRNGE